MSCTSSSTQANYLKIKSTVKSPKTGSKGGHEGEPRNAAAWHVRRRMTAPPPSRSSIATRTPTRVFPITIHKGSTHPFPTAPTRSAAPCSATSPQGPWSDHGRYDGPRRLRRQVARREQRGRHRWRDGGEEAGARRSGRRHRPVRDAAGRRPGADRPSPCRSRWPTSCFPRRASRSSPRAAAPPRSASIHRQPALPPSSTATGSTRAPAPRTTRRRMHPDYFDTPGRLAQPDPGESISIPPVRMPGDQRGRHERRRRAARERPRPCEERRRRSLRRRGSVLPGSS